jgi:cephalosporin-C deacetylase-like acetyl esterase
VIHPNYPTSQQVDQWCDKLLRDADAVQYTATPTEMPDRPGEVRARHTTGQFMAFETRFSVGGGGTSNAERFYVYFQPVHGGGPAPLLVHLPGYGGELSMHPELVAAGFNVLHVNPRGYFTPQGPDNTRLLDGAWPVLPETVMSLGERGYVNWYRDALVAVRWARTQTSVQGERLGFFGTSQGGGTALVLSSILRGRSVKAVAADLPFLTHFPMMSSKKDTNAYFLAFARLDQLEKQDPAKLPQAWHALGYIDTMCHAHRLTMPVLLTAGSTDTICLPETIKALFEALPGTRSYTGIAGQDHAYTVPFLPLARAWFGLYV